MPTLDIQEYFVLNYSFVPGEIAVIPRFYTANTELGWEPSIAWLNDFGIIKSPTNTSVSPKHFATPQDAMDYFYSVASADVLSQANAIYGSGFY
ncbi:hypothetical protein G3V88_23895, partial [Escherichia coli]|nr:hypothetical protein [Escherichia coli]